MTLNTHRVAYALAWGDPGDLLVCHSCDNKLCCNPSHMFLGTQADNVADMITKGRRVIGVVPPERRPRGESHHGAKLTESDVRDIRRAITEGGATQRELAARYGVNPMAISNIRHGKRWGWLDADGTAS